MKTISFKKRVLLILSFVMCMAFLASGAIFSVNTANADATGFETVKDAQIRIHNEKERLGIRYQLRMESGEYKNFMETYTDVEFGAFIIPEDYRQSKGAFTEENLFTNPIYYWGDVTEEYKAGKTQIINLSTEAMTKIEEVDGVSYNTVYAAITNVKTQNATRAFAGVGYVKYTDGETVKYIISDNGSEYSYSIAQVANNALENLELEDDQVAAIEQITAIKPAVKVSADKGESAIKTAVSELNYAMGAELDITAVANANAPAGMIVDEENSVLTATVPFVGYAEFDVNYVYDVENLDGKNLLEYANLFDADAGIATLYDGCVESNADHPGCWAQHLDISSSTTQNYGFSGKYINLQRNGYCHIGFALDHDFVSELLDAGYTTVKVVALRSNEGMGICSFDVDMDAPSFGTQINVFSTEVADNGVVTFTFDFENKTFNNDLFFHLNSHPNSALYIYDLSFSAPVVEPVTTTGNLAQTLKSSGIATSTKNVEGQGQLFHYGTNNTLYFNAWSGYGNYIVFDSDYVANCFELGLTNIKIKYYVTNFADGGWVKIGPAKFDGVNKPEYLSSRAESPWLKATYTSDNPIETTWVITPEEVASFNFAAGDKFYIGEMASASGKSQIVITHFEFCQPEPEEIDYNGLNLLTLDGVFGDIIQKLECDADPAVHTKCWVQYLDISASDAATWGCEGKYINMSRTGGCDVGIYFDYDFYQQMLDAGYTTLTLVAEKGKEDMNVKFYDYNAASGKLWGDRIEGNPTTDANGITTWTFDLTTITITGTTPMIGMTGGIDSAIYFFNINFSK